MRNPLSYRDSLDSLAETGQDSRVKVARMGGWKVLTNSQAWRLGSVPF